MLSLLLCEQFVMSHNWQVVAGEESKEVEAQNIRETRVLEAVYPRPSAIPPRLTFYLFIYLILSLEVGLYYNPC